VRALLAGDRRVTGGVLNITAAAWTTGFQWWRSGDIRRTQNLSEYMLVEIKGLRDVAMATNFGTKSVITGFV